MIDKQRHPYLFPPMPTIPLNTTYHALSSLPVRVNGHNLGPPVQPKTAWAANHNHVGLPIRFAASSDIESAENLATIMFSTIPTVCENKALVQVMGAHAIGGNKFAEQIRNMYPTDVRLILTEQEHTAFPTQQTANTSITSMGAAGGLYQGEYENKGDLLVCIGPEILFYNPDPRLQHASHIAAILVLYANRFLRPEGILRVLTANEKLADAILKESAAHYLTQQHSVLFEDTNKNVFEGALIAGRLK